MAWTEEERTPVRPDVAAALKLAQDNCPPYPTELLKELGAYDIHMSEHPKARWRQSKPFFRKWWWYVGGCPDGAILDSVSMCLQDGDLPNGVLDLTDIGYNGMWVARVNQKEKPLIYCAVPSLKHGRLNAGGTCDMGEEKIRLGWKQQEVDDLLRKGYAVMEEMIAEFGAYVPDENNEPA